MSPQGDYRLPLLLDGGPVSFLPPAWDPGLVRNQGDRGDLRQAVMTVQKFGQRCSPSMSTPQTSHRGHENTVVFKKYSFRSSRCGATRLAVPLQRQDADSIPSPAQWVKGSGIATAVA